MIILDASVGVKWFLVAKEQDREIALQIQEDHLDGKEIIVVPELFFIEIANVLLIKAGIPLSRAREVNEILFSMNLRVLSVDEKLMDLALYVSGTRKITVYDALYIATSIILSSPFITADEKLYQKTKDVFSILLREYSTRS